MARGMTDEQPDYTARLQVAADEAEETYAQHDMCFVEACEDVSPDLPSMIRGVGWLWWR